MKHLLLHVLTTVSVQISVWGQIPDTLTLPADSYYDTANGYYSAVFEHSPQDPLLVFSNESAPPGTYTYVHYSPHELKLLDTSKRIVIAFYDLFYLKRYQTAIIGILFVEDSSERFRPVCIDTFPVVRNKYGNDDIHVGGAIINGQKGELDVLIVYGRPELHTNDAQTYIHYVYEWPADFDRRKELKLLRTW